MSYLYKKGFEVAKPPKPRRLKFLTGDQVRQILDACRATGSSHWRRDHAAIFLGYYFGLRIGEAVLLERADFQFISDGEAQIKTLKQSAKIPVQCENPDCRRNFRLSLKRSGQPFRCTHCDQSMTVPVVHARASLPTFSPPVIERHVINYVTDYLASGMRPNQRWLFEGRVGQHISIEQLRTVFATYCAAAGLDTLYSWHALRHGRGVLLWEQFNDSVLVRDCLRQKSIKSTEEYLRLSPRRVTQAQEILARQAELAGLSDEGPMSSPRVISLPIPDLPEQSPGSLLADPPALAANPSEFDTLEE